MSVPQRGTIQLCGRVLAIIHGRPRWFEVGEASPRPRNHLCRLRMSYYAGFEAGCQKCQVTLPACQRLHDRLFTGPHMAWRGSDCLPSQK